MATYTYNVIAGNDAVSLDVTIKRICHQFSSARVDVGRNSSNLILQVVIKSRRIDDQVKQTILAIIKRSGYSEVKKKKRCT